MNRPASLAWRLGALGDTLLLLPALAALRAAFPGREIVAAGNRSALEAALWSGLIDRTIDASDARLAPLSRGVAPAGGILPANLECAIVWSNRHAELCRGLALAGARKVIGAPAIPAGNTPAAAHYLDTLAALEIRPVPFRLQAPPRAMERTAMAWQAAMGRQAGQRAIVLHPGAGSPLKQWPAGHYVQLAQLLRAEGFAVLWSCGPADDAVRAALDAAGESAHILDPTDLAGLAAYLTRAAAMVSGDCGVAHLAALLDIPALALFGPTDYRVWGPPGARHAVVHLNMICSPCGEMAKRCPTRICLRGLAVRTVYEALLDHVAHANGAHTTSGRDRQAGSCAPGALRCPPPVSGPPGLLQVARWAGGRTPRERWWTGTG